MARKRSRKKSACQCLNHMGTKKQQFPDRDAAIAAIMKRHLWTGKTFSIYECPTSPRWHVTGKSML